MAISLVQTATQANSSSSSIAKSFTSTTVSGNFIIVASVNDSSMASVLTISDNKSNTYTKLYDLTSGSFDVITLWYAANITGGSSHQVTITNSSNWNVMFYMREYSGIATASSADKNTSATGSSAALSSGATATTTQANELVVGHGASSWGSGQTYTVGSGYGNLVSQTGTAGDIGLEDKIISSTGTQTATFTVGNSFNWVCAVATFKAVATTATPITLALMGVGA